MQNIGIDPINSIALPIKRDPVKTTAYIKLLDKLECANPDCENGYDIEVHHIIPLNRGGEDAFWNMVPLCFECHRHNKLHSDYDERKAELFAWKTYKELDALGFVLDEREDKFDVHIKTLKTKRAQSEASKRQIKSLLKLIKEQKRVQEDLKQQIIALNEREIATNAKLDGLLADLKTYKVFSDGLRIEELREEVDLLRAEVTRSRSTRKPGKKTDQRKNALANQLVAIKNIGMTYAQIGKFLELGTRRNGKNTREQNMTHFGKLLEADKKSFVVTDGKTNGGKLVKLTKIYYEHLLRGEP